MKKEMEKNESGENGQERKGGMRKWKRIMEM